MAEKRRYAADGADFAFNVVKREIPFGRSIKFEHARNVESFLESLPHVGTKPVAAGEPQSVRAFARMTGRMHQITAQLADILEQRAVEIADVVPEFLRGKFVADDDGAAVHQYGAGRDNAADRMIHRQTIVHAVVRAAVHQAGEPQTPLQQPLMADIGGLRQSGRARGVDQERAVADMRGAAFGGRQGAAWIACDGLIDLQRFRRRSPRHAPRGSAGSPDARAPFRTHRPIPRRR